MSKKIDPATDGVDLVGEMTVEILGAMARYVNSRTDMVIQRKERVVLSSIACVQTIAALLAAHYGGKNPEDLERNVGAKIRSFVGEIIQNLDKEFSDGTEPSDSGDTERDPV